MNYTVLRGADTAWGQQFALKLAAEKRHLILLGRDIFTLTDLAFQVRTQGNREAVVYQVDTSDSKSIIAICGILNAAFEIDCFINYVESDGINDKWADRSVFELDQLLKSAQHASLLFTHQLLPNLLLHGHSQIVNVFDNTNNHSPTSRWLTESTCHFFDGLKMEYKENGLAVYNIQAKCPEPVCESSAAKRPDFC